MIWNMASTLFSILDIAVLLATSLFIGFSLVDLDLNKYVKRILLVSFFAGIFHYGLSFFIQDTIVSVFVYILLFIIIFFLFKISIIQAAIVVLLGSIFDMAIVKLLELNLFDVLLSYSQVESDPVILGFLTIFIMMTNIFIAQLVYRKSPVLISKTWFNQPSDEDETYSTNKLSFFYIIAILLAMNIFLYYTYLEIGNFRSHFRIFIIFWNLLLCGVFVFFIRYILYYQEERTQLFLDRQYQNDLHSFFKVIRSQRHDFNLHLNTINGLIQSGKYNECQEYIEEVVTDAQHINDLLPLSHPAIAAMLNTLGELANQKDIEIQYYLQDDLRHIPCSVYETNKILGNLIHNAIDEVDKHVKDDRTITVEIKKEHEQIVMTATNPTMMSPEQLHSIFEFGYSTKEHHHGIGLPTVQNILENYNGVLFPELIDDKLSMHVRIPIAQ